MSIHELAETHGFEPFQHNVVTDGMKFSGINQHMKDMNIVGYVLIAVTGCLYYWRYDVKETNAYANSVLASNNCGAI